MFQKILMYITPKKSKRKEEKNMLNNTVLVGRLTSNPTIEENENGAKVCKITLAVTRSYKNVNGEYDTDFIPCVLWKGIAENTAEYCRQGDLVGVKGRIQTSEGKIEIVADKVTFLSTAKKED